MGSMEKNGFDDWFNNASVDDISKNIKSVKRALRNGGYKHEMFPFSEAVKAKSLGFTAQELKAMAPLIEDIYFVDVVDKKQGI